MIEDMIARPMWQRFTRRHAGQSLYPPTENDRRDAIRVLREVHVVGHQGWWMAVMQIEAERVLDWSGQ